MRLVLPWLSGPGVFLLLHEVWSDTLSSDLIHPKRLIIDGDWHLGSVKKIKE